MSNCAYCDEGQFLAPFGIKICELDNSKLYLFKEQSHLGRVILAPKKHVGELMDLTKEERAGFFDDMAKVATAIHKLFNPAKINYGAYGDTAGHMHFHLVPKYKEGFEWGGIFLMNPDKKYLSDEEYAEIVAKFKDAVK